MNPARAEIPLAPLQEAFALSGLSANEVARRTGWNESYVRRNLRPGGWQYVWRTTADGTRRRYRSQYHSVCYENAVKFARAMDVDPWELDL